MDIHIVPGVKARDVAEAHSKDLLHQTEHQCKCMTYWIDEQRESIFCLIEAPDKQAVETMHNNAHGLIPNKIIEVNSAVVESFLGRIYDPENAVTTDDGLKVFTEPSFRILLMARMADPVLLRRQFGKEKTTEIISRFTEVVRKNVFEFQGREAEHSGHDMLCSFVSAKNALNAAMNIQTAFLSYGDQFPEFRLGLHAGEPVASTDTIFGDTIRVASYLCTMGKNGQLVISSSVHELVAKENLHRKNDQLMALTPQDERALDMLFTRLEENWTDPDFDITEYCMSTTMSKSQLYRKSISLTGLSPNILLKEFRLEKAKELLKQQKYSISQISFETGFTSPSYFTKCFKKQYGLLPMEYLDLIYT